MQTPVRSLEEVHAVAIRDVRPMYVYDMPESLASQTGIRQIGMVELTAGEELMAAKRAGNDAVKLAAELTKEALRTVNGDAVNSADGSADEFWGREKTGMSKVRQLALGAYNQIHNPSNEEAGSFLLSKRIQVR